jgi:hypothetical protein
VNAASGYLPNQLVATSLLRWVPFALLDAAKGAKPIVVQIGIQKAHACASGLQDTQSERVGAEDYPEKPIVENFVRWLGVRTKDDRSRTAPQLNAFRTMPERIFRMFRIGDVLSHWDMHDLITLRLWQRRGAAGIDLKILDIGGAERHGSPHFFRHHSESVPVETIGIEILSGELDL